MLITLVSVCGSKWPVLGAKYIACGQVDQLYCAVAILDDSVTAGWQGCCCNGKDR